MSLPEVRANYLARAIGCSFGVSGNGNYQVAIDCEITEGDHAGERISWIGTLSQGKATEISLRALKESFGWAGDDLAELAEIDAETAARLLPNVVELACDMEEYDGVWRLKVKWVNKPGGGRFAFKEPLTGDRLRAFSAQMKGTIRGMAGGRRSSSTPSQQAPHPNAPGGGIDDDVPF